jgi:hypothetical protein
VPSELRLAIAHTLRGSRIVRGREHMTKAEALAALTEEA